MDVSADEADGRWELFLGEKHMTSCDGDYTGLKGDVLFFAHSSTVFNDSLPRP